MVLRNSAIEECTTAKLFHSLWLNGSANSPFRGEKPMALLGDKFDTTGMRLIDAS